MSQFGASQFGVALFGGGEPVIPLDLDPPYLSGYIPTGTGIDSLATVYLYINDDGTGAVQDTLDVDIDGSPAVIGGVIQAGWDGVGSSIVPNAFGGFVVILVPTTPMSSAKTILVAAYIEDTNGNAMSDGWSFTVEDYLGPLINPTDPQPSSINVAFDTHLYISITDESGVVDGSILVEIDRGYGFVTALEQGGSPEFKDGYDGPSSQISTVSGGYEIVIDPIEDFPPAATVYVRVTAVDPIGNPGRLS